MNYPTQNRPPPNTMAIVSVVCGGLGWVGVPVIASVIAVICGHMARAQIRQTGEEGDVLAIVGMVLGYVHLVMMCFVFGMLFLIYGSIFVAMIGAAVMSETGQL